MSSPVSDPLPVISSKKFMPQAYKDLETTYKRLERHHRDMLDLEFTIQEGKLYMLQTRVGKRTGVAAVRIAVDMVKEGSSPRRRRSSASGRISWRSTSIPFSMPRKNRNVRPRKGLPAGPELRPAKLALTADRAVEMKAAGDRVVLVRRNQPGRYSRHECRPGLSDCARGGGTSHAAVVARQMGKVCGAGCEAIEVVDNQTVRIGTRPFREGEICPSTGRPVTYMAVTFPWWSPRSSRCCRAKWRLRRRRSISSSNRC